MSKKDLLEVRNQDFSGIISLSKYVQWNALSFKNFVDCKFIKIDFLGNYINSCTFENSELNHFNFRKCQFESCNFKNCLLTNVDFTRAEFIDCSFTNCNLVKSDLAASDFLECEFVETLFKNNNLNFIGARNAKLKCSNVKL